MMQDEQTVQVINGMIPNSVVIVDMGKTNQFHTLSSQYGHALSKRYVLGVIVDFVGLKEGVVVWVALINANQPRSILTMPLVADNWRVVRSSLTEHMPLMTCWSADDYDLPYIIPGQFYTTLAKARCEMANVAEHHFRVAKKDRR